MTISSDLPSVRTKHRTDKYKTNALVVRRGFPVTLQTDAPSLSFSIFNVRSTRNQPVSYSFTLSPGDKTPDGWALSRDSSATLTLQVPADAPVGAYRLQDNGDNSAIAMVVLFNPFSADDSVHMPDEAMLEESLLNNAGRIWRGTANSNAGTSWQYAQFQTVVLVASIDLLDAAAAGDLAVRRNPITLTRALSALMNSSDADDGVIVGNWSGDYEDGTSPTAWTGSAEILTEYWESGSKPVSYGQCWVFAGVFTSVLRSLGIPATTVSNFASAHETTRPYNRVVERFFGPDGTPQSDKDLGSTWNFHVWNQAWMKRPDLDEVAAEHGLDYNGWQILDGTPQEPSMGLFQLGPAPLDAIKYGHEVPYDADFVISEVNSDMVYYLQTAEGSEEYRAIRKDERAIGKAISIKSEGSNVRDDVTLRYKFAEGTPEERESFNNRPSASVRPEVDDDEPVEFGVDVPDAVSVGDDVVYTLRLRNTGTEDGEATTVHFNLQVDVTDYTGQSMGRLGSRANDVVVPSGGNRERSLVVPAEAYEGLLARGAQTVHFITTAVVSGSGQAWSNETLVYVGLTGLLTLSGVPTEMQTGERTTAMAVVRNTTQTTLTGLVLRIEGEDLTARQRVSLDDLAPGRSTTTPVEIVATAAGEKVLTLTLDSRELRDISTSETIQVSGPGASAWDADDAADVDSMVGVNDR